MKKNDIEKIRKALKDYGVYPDEVSEIEGFVAISISWGDWKHEHGACKRVMRDLGYDLVESEVTEEDGSDCYSADYKFKLEA